MVSAGACCHERMYETMLEMVSGVSSTIPPAPMPNLCATSWTGPFSASPVAAVSQGRSPHLYIVSEKGLLQCVDLSGAEGRVVSQLDLQETILATPALSDNAIYLRSDKHLWKIR